MMMYDNTGVTVELGDIVASGVNIWDFEYPTPAPVIHYNGKTADVPFDKEAFQQKIIDHYRFRQIGQETVGRWLHYFRTRIREIMPYYVQLYEFEAKWANVDDPLESYNLKETYEEENSNTGTSKNTGSGEVTHGGTNILSPNTKKTIKFSDTPQGSVSNLDGYLTNATVEETSGEDRSTEQSSDVSNNSSEGESSYSGSVSHTLTRRGNIGVQPLGGEVRDIRQAFINIDLMVINELKDLFLQVY